MTSTDRALGLTKTAELSADLRQMIDTGTLSLGERLPSVRELARVRRLSVTTVVQAYRELEALDVVEARLRSGYYVKFDSRNAIRSTPRRRLTPAPAGLQDYYDLMPELLAEAGREGRVLRLGVASLEGDLLPQKVLAQLTRKVLRTRGARLLGYADPIGLEALRKRIARLVIEHGISISADDIVVTSGCQEALSIALLCLCRPGDVVAVQSPCYPGVLKAMQVMGLRAVEVPTIPAGLDLDALEAAIRKNKVRACYVMPNCANPTGLIYSEDTKRGLCKLAAQYDLPVIEDSANADLHFGFSPLSALKHYDAGGLVLYCASFSKTVAPAFRVGWLIAGRFARQAEQLKYALSIGVPLLQQVVIERFIAEGGYRRSVSHARPVLAATMSQLLRCVEEGFPAGTDWHRPYGGMCAWIRLPPAVDGERLRRQALDVGVSIAPGRMFSPFGVYRNHIRLGWGGKWTDRAATGTLAVGSIARSLSGEKRPGVASP
jgi:DNA-binding transcriptional MocR family regulator